MWTFNVGQSNYSEMKCVVTGGCGFIGYHLVDRLISLGHEVTAIDNLATGAISHLNSEAKLVQGSVADLELMVFATESADWVFHTAALARIERSMDDPVGTPRSQRERDPECPSGGPRERG